MTFVGEGANNRESGFSETGSKMIPPRGLLELPAGEITIGDLLLHAGYATAALGKWHVGRVSPSEHGFQVNDGATSNRGPGGNDHPNPQEAYGMTERGLDFMARQVKAGRPFYLQLSHYPGRSGAGRPEGHLRGRAEAGRRPGGPGGRRRRGDGGHGRHHRHGLEEDRRAGHRGKDLRAVHGRSWFAGSRGQPALDRRQRLPAGRRHPGPLRRSRARGGSGRMLPRPSDSHGPVSHVRRALGRERAAAQGRRRRKPGSVAERAAASGR